MSSGAELTSTHDLSSGNNRLSIRQTPQTGKNIRFVEYQREDLTVTIPTDAIYTHIHRGVRSSVLLYKTLNVSETLKGLLSLNFSELTQNILTKLL